MRGISIEQLAYLGLMLAALLAHLWQLGDRALHHDETLHAYYSWLIYTGQGYVHDPLLHGPFLYFASAFIYLLFDDSNTTARLSAALFGTVLVGLPYLLRRELGRGTALLAATYLLISPAFLYVGRFIRHDIFAVTFELLTFIGVVRYATTRQPHYLYLAAASLALMSTTMETSYLYTVIFLPVLAALLLWRVWRPGLALIAALGLAVILCIFVLPGKAQKDGENNALRDASGSMQHTPGPIFGWYPLETDDNGFALRVRNRPDDNLFAYLGEIGPFFGHPGVLLSIGLTMATLAGLYFMIWRRRDKDGLTAWQRARQQNDSTLEAFASLTADRRLWVAAGIFLLIYGLFYTAFFTNMLGMVTGTTGSLLYWLAQHGVKRGGQPGHYYLVLMAIYEPLLLLWGMIGLGMALRNLVGYWRSGSGINTMLMVIAWWALAALGIYSWAGEKMPWLTIHIWLPWTLLGAWAMAHLVPRLLHQPQAADAAQSQQAGSLLTRTLLLYLAGFGVVFGLGFVLLTVYSSSQSEGQLAGMVLLVLLVLCASLVLIASLTQGWRWGVGGALIALSLMLCLYTLRSAWHLSYRYGDVAREAMVFVQTSPDVARVMERLEEASIRRTGRLDLPVIYDNETVWLWYLRDFREATNSGPTLAGSPAPEVMAVLMLYDNYNANDTNRSSLQEFQVQRYPLRWWFPESETYRLGEGWTTSEVENLSLLGRVLRDPLSERTLTDLWNYLLYRRPPGALGSTDFIIAVRPELALEIGLGTGATAAP